MVIIPGEPKGKGRPRMNTRTGKAYTPDDTVSYENLVKVCYQEQSKLKYEGQIKAKIKAYYSIPKSTSKKKREQMLLGDLMPTKKPDLDNVAKIVLDSLNKIAFDDDSQIVSLTVEKYYSETPRVEVYLAEM